MHSSAWSHALPDSSARQSLPEMQDRPAQRVWLLVALLSHTGWGAYPVLARYLQTVSQLPSMALLALGNLLALVVLARFLVAHIDMRLWRSPLVWLLALAVLGRAPTNILAARFTLAIYVQLVTLSTPFLVVLLNRLFFHQHIPQYTGLAMLLSLLGSLMMLSSGAGLTGVLFIAPTTADWMGMGLALVSSGFLALYMLLVRRAAQAGIAAESVFVVQVVAATTIALLLSLLLGEDWSRWGQIGLSDWLVFAAFSLGVFVVANVSNIGALRHLGAPFVSSMLGWRLVVVLVLSYLLLGEQLTTVWQVAGALLVLATISWYVGRNARAA